MQATSGASRKLRASSSSHSRDRGLAVDCACRCCSRISAMVGSRSAINLTCVPCGKNLGCLKHRRQRHTGGRAGDAAKRAGSLHAVSSPRCAHARCVKIGRTVAASAPLSSSRSRTSTVAIVRPTFTTCLGGEHRGVSGARMSPRMSGVARRRICRFKCCTWLGQTTQRRTQTAWCETSRRSPLPPPPRRRLWAPWTGS